MAKDLTKPRMPTVSFAHASAKEAILQDLEKKKAERQRRLRQLQLDEAAAAEKQRRTKEEAAERASACIVPEELVVGTGAVSSPERVPTASRMRDSSAFQEDPTSSSRPDAAASAARAPMRRGPLAMSSADLSGGESWFGPMTRADVGGDAAHQREALAGRSVSPSWALLERSVRSHSFGATTRSLSAAPHRYVRPSPGPGSYLGLEAAHASLSYVARPPSAVIPRGAASALVAVDGTGGVGGGGGWEPTASSLAAWRMSDPAAALDRIKRRPPVAVIGTLGLAAISDEEEEESDGAELIEIRYSQVEPRVKGVIVMRTPAALPIGDDNGDARDDARDVEGVDPWALDGLLRARKPSWSFGQSDRWSEAASSSGGLMVRPPQLLYPNYELVKPRAAVGIPKFAAFLNLRCVSAFQEVLYSAVPSLISIMMHQPTELPPGYLHVTPKL